MIYQEHYALLKKLRDNLVIIMIHQMMMILTWQTSNMADLSEVNCVEQAAACSHG